jgi:putative flippase GtrA
MIRAENCFPAPLYTSLAVYREPCQIASLRTPSFLAAWAFVLVLIDRAIRQISRSLVFKRATIYALFALIATATNIGAQELVIRGYTGAFAVLLSVVVGTAVGLVVKYVLDKRYIFRFRSRDAVHEGQTLLAYTVIGLVTTVIFLSFEFGFNRLFETKEMRYIGAISGLALGYLAKYHLDKRFTFNTDAE